MKVQNPPYKYEAFGGEERYIFLTQVWPRLTCFDVALMNKASAEIINLRYRAGNIQWAKHIWKIVHQFCQKLADDCQEIQEIKENFEVFWYPPFPTEKRTPFPFAPLLIEHLMFHMAQGTKQAKQITTLYFVGKQVLAYSRKLKCCLLHLGRQKKYQNISFCLRFLLGLSCSQQESYCDENIFAPVLPAICLNKRRKQIMPLLKPYFIIHFQQSTSSTVKTIETISST